MPNKFKIITGTSTKVEKELNDLAETSFVRVITTTGTADELVVVAYVKPNKEDKDGEK